VIASLLVSAGCSHMPALHWPWHRSPPPPPTPVHELDISGTSSAFPQYWKRNTLLVDLSGATGSGSITLKPTEGSTWPVRLALRVTPGSIGVLDVRGAERSLLPITGSGHAPVDLELTPGIVTPSTPQVTVSWAPLTQSAPTLW
jgi:hypothetical protein